MLGWQRYLEEYNLLATLFNIEISGLPDRFLTEIEENVNVRTQNEVFSKITFENRKNMQSHIVVCDSRDRQYWYINAGHNIWT
jgi:hypothetical protein